MTDNQKLLEMLNLIVTKYKLKEGVTGMMAIPYINKATSDITNMPAADAAELVGQLKAIIEK